VASQEERIFAAQGSSSLEDAGLQIRIFPRLGVSPTGYVVRAPIANWLTSFLPERQRNLVQLEAFSIEAQIQILDFAAAASAAPPPRRATPAASEKASDLRNVRPTCRIPALTGTRSPEFCRPEALSRQRTATGG